MKPVAFSKFVLAVGGPVLTPAQETFGKVAFDGVEPGALDGEKRELSHELFGNVEEVPRLARGTVAMLKGARVAGSLMGGIKGVQSGLTLPWTTGAPGESLYVVFVGPDMRLAHQPWNYALGAAKSHPEIARRIESESADSFSLRRDDGRLVIFECLPATKGGSALRGRSLAFVHFVEGAYFRDSNYVINDAELYKAVDPRVIAGGIVFIESTPSVESGLLFDLFTTNYGNPTTALAVRAPTLLMRTDDHTRSLVERAKLKDAEAAAQEFECQWVAVGSSLFFDGGAVDACVDRSMVHPFPYDPNAGSATGLDIGLEHDSSAITIVQMNDTRSWLAFYDEIRPSRGCPLVPGDVVRRFAGHMRTYNTNRAVADKHYILSVREHGAPLGISVWEAPGGSTGKLETHLAGREVINERKFRMSFIPRLIAQLKEIRQKPISGGGMQITSPRRAGQGHGDIASALILSLWSVRASTRGQAERAASEARRTQLDAGLAAYGGPHGLRAMDQLESTLPAGMNAAERRHAVELLAAGYSRDFACASPAWRRALLFEQRQATAKAEAEREAKAWDAFVARGGVDQSNHHQ
jgi:hypothetical protein